MGSWDEVESDAGELAGAVRGRFEAYGLALLATLRADGFPRISGVEPLFAAGELWLGMMEHSRKALDLHRDPRCALHNATTDKDVHDGDVKITGRGIAVVGAAKDAYRASWREQRGTEVPEPFELFRVDVAELARIMPAGDHLLIQSWRTGGAVREAKR